MSHNSIFCVPNVKLINEWLMKLHHCIVHIIHDFEVSCFCFISSQIRKGFINGYFLLSYSLSNKLFNYWITLNIYLNIIISWKPLIFLAQLIPRIVLSVFFNVFICTFSIVLMMLCKYLLDLIKKRDTTHLNSAWPLFITVPSQNSYLVFLNRWIVTI